MCSSPSGTMCNRRSRLFLPLFIAIRRTAGYWRERSGGRAAPHRCCCSCSPGDAQVNGPRSTCTDWVRGTVGGVGWGGGVWSCSSYTWGRRGSRLQGWGQRLQETKLQEDRSVELKKVLNLGSSCEWEGSRSQRYETGKLLFLFLCNHGDRAVK